MYTDSDYWDLFETQEIPVLNMEEIGDSCSFLLATIIGGKLIVST
jgi:hypothetical protein